MTKFQKGSKELIILASIAVLVAAFIILFIRTQPSKLTTVDLDTVSKELDSANLDQIDSGLNELSSDATSL